jgi:amino acid transporter
MAEPPQAEPTLPELPELPPGPAGTHIESRAARAVQRIFGAIIGPARRITDPHLFHKVSLAAFLAWVGLGADGLSSSSYGPEAAWLALHGNTFLALPLAALTALTVMILAASYIRIIERFPAGGGGYMVASKMLGPIAGVVSGSALVVDYILTTTISLAACTDALFSLAPAGFQPWKLLFTLGLLATLTVLNLRGVRESVTAISPIFLVFLASHAAALATGIVVNLHRIPTEFAHLAESSATAISQTGWIPLVLVLLRAFTLGGGTYTGIEAVSEGMPLLRDPKVETAKATMRYMAVSLALVAGSILVCYLIYHVQPVPGKTLNAVLWSAIAGQILPPGSPLAQALIAIVLVSAGALLFVAAQTGFLGGPRVLVFMALDRWVPSRFANLSERLVSSNGVMLVSLGSLAVLLATGGHVHILVVLYSINVFLTFTLAQAGMVRDAFERRRAGESWKRGLLVSGTGFIVTAVLLVGTVAFKFVEGGWATLLVTALLTLLCAGIHRHYVRTSTSLKRLDEALTTVPLPPGEPVAAPMQRLSQTAILTVTNFAGLGIHTLLNQFRIFPNQFKQIVFISVGVIDSGRFKGASELHALEESTKAELQKYVDFARRLGFPAEYRYSMGTDVVDELEKLCLLASKDYPRSVTFGGQLVFQKEGATQRWLHNQTCPALQRRLAFHGLPMVILPVRVY